MYAQKTRCRPAQSYRVIGLVCAGFWLGGAVAPAAAQVIPLDEGSECLRGTVRQAQGQWKCEGGGTVNWTSGWITAVGKGAPPPNPANSAQSRMMAERAAKVDGYRALLEVVNGVRVDAATLVENYTVTNDVIKVEVSGIVKGAIPVKTEFQPDGGAEVTLRMPLAGGKSLANVFLNEKKIQPLNGPQASSPEEGVSGVVIDARGLGVKPAMFPALVDDKGQVVFGPEQVDRAATERDGMVQYKVLPKGADLSSVFGEGQYVIRPVQNAPIPPREGHRPLKVKGASSAGVFRANIMISSDDVKKLQSNPQAMAAFRRARVVVVTDPLIGGMEGRAPGMVPEGERLVAELVPTDLK